MYHLFYLVYWKSGKHQLLTNWHCQWQLEIKIFSQRSLGARQAGIKSQFFSESCNGWPNLLDFTVTSDKEDSRSLTWQVLRPPVDQPRKKILRCKFPSIGQQWICARLLTIDWVAWFGFVGLKQTRGLVKHQAIKINLDNLAKTSENI